MHACVCALPNVYTQINAHRLNRFTYVHTAIHMYLNKISPLLLKGHVLEYKPTSLSGHVLSKPLQHIHTVTKSTNDTTEEEAGFIIDTLYRITYGFINT